MVNYYKQSIPKMAERQLSLPIYIKNSIKNDKTNIIWTPLADEAFIKFKHALNVAAQSSFPSLTSKFTFTADKPIPCNGTVLEQFENGTIRPIGFFFRNTNTEKRCSTYDRELLTIHPAIEYIHHRLEARYFIIKTDH